MELCPHVEYGGTKGRMQLEIVGLGVLNKRRKRRIFHFAWADIRTFLETYRNDDGLANLEAQLLAECLRFFWNNENGIATYDAMPSKWPEFV